MFDYLDNAVIKLCEMPTVGTDLGTVKQQIEELKVGKRCKCFLNVKQSSHTIFYTKVLLTVHIISPSYMILFTTTHTVSS